VAGHKQVQPWWDEVASVTAEWYVGREQAQDAEGIAIAVDKPRYNFRKPPAEGAITRADAPAHVARQLRLPAGTPLIRCFRTRGQAAVEVRWIRGHAGLIARPVRRGDRDGYRTALPEEAAALGLPEGATVFVSTRMLALDAYRPSGISEIIAA